MKILITGDLVINRTYSAESIDAEILKVFGSSDYNIVNLEAPITESEDKIIKTGPYLKSNKESTKNVLNSLNIDLVTLANNHIMDYGSKGLNDTISFCEENNVHYVGAGNNMAAASRVHYLTTNELNIAFYNVAENEWASATSTCGGANGMDVIDDAKLIKKVSKEVDYLFVIVHGGHEYYNLPSPRMKKQYQFYIDCGADIVVGHHPHCISGNEVYNGKPIYYSLGNFLFTKNNIHDQWYEGAILEVILSAGVLATKLHFIQQEKDTFSLKKLKDTDQVEKKISDLNSIIQDDDKLDYHWNDFVLNKSRLFTHFWSPVSLFGSKIKSFALRLGFSGLKKGNAALFYNLIRCESHRDISLQFLKRKIINK